MQGHDHIVIGAGSAGCAVAARLSEDPRRQVLLLEAGGSDLSLNVRAPLAFSNQFHGKGDWNIHTEPEPACAGRRIYEPRAKILGGCSSMNAMLWIRGCPQDYDDWRVPGWGWEDVEPFYRRSEDGHLGDSSLGRGGPMRISRMAAPGPTTEAFVKATAQATEAPHNPANSGPDLHGVSVAPVTVWKGQRWNAARGYLRPARNRPNLTILKKALVRRIVIRDGRAVGVEYEHRGRLRSAMSRSDIVLSAGAFGTPQLLQISGVGDSGHLREIGVRCLVDNEAVGEHLSEHPMTTMNWEISPASGDIGLSDATHPKYLLQWLRGGRGKLSSNVAEAVAHIKSQPGLANPDFQLINGPTYYWDNGAGEHPNPATVIAQSYWTPASRGSVKARSAEPGEPPLVRLNLMSERSDVEAMIRAIRISREIAATEPLASRLGVEIQPGPEAQTDEQIEQWVRETCVHTYHPSCTARIGERGDGVLDPELRVHGVEGLRVADASALRAVTRANTNAPAIMIGERCAELIRYGLRRPPISDIAAGATGA